MAAAAAVPPGPKSLPLVGGVYALRHDPLAAVTELNRIYGGFVLLGNVGRTPMYLVSDPVILKHVLQDNYKNYRKGRAAQRMRSVFGEGSLLLEGEVWRRRRKLIQPPFHRHQIGAVGSSITQATLDMLERWSEHARRREPLEVREQMLALTMTLTVKNLFKSDVSGQVRELVDAWQVLFEDVTTSRFSLFRLPPGVPTPANRRRREALATVDRVLVALIEERRRRPRDDGSLLGLLVEARDEQGEGLTDKELRDEVMTLFIGGYETSSNAAAFSLAMLSLHRAAAERLAQELAVLGGRTPTVADLPRLPYNRWVLEETMRMFPPSWTITREPIEDDVIGGFLVRAGSQLLCSQYATHHDARLWPNPECFDPERFEPARVAERARFAYFPFGGGPRICLGEQYALTEIQLILATIQQRFALELCPGYPITPRAMLGIRPRYPLRVIPVDRLRPFTPASTDATR